VGLGAGQTREEGWWTMDTRQKDEMTNPQDEAPERAREDFARADEALNRAWDAYDRAWDARDLVIAEHHAELEAWHEKWCPVVKSEQGCRWDGKRLVGIGG
jgi:hypothetical protein